MSWEDDEFEQELSAYSEIETIPKGQVKAPLPRTIQQYQQKIQENNSSSIFDLDYSLGASTINSTLHSGKVSNDDDLGVFKDEIVTYHISGRGRGGRNIYIKNPGEVNRNKLLNEDDEVRQQIRKVAPIGYTNEITESAVRAHRMAQLLEKDSNANATLTIENMKSPTVSNSNSLRASPVANGISPARSNTQLNMNVESPILSEKSTPSDVQSSEYFTSQDHNVSSSSSKSIQNEELESREECSDALAASISTTQSMLEVPTGTIPKKPVPLSVMLKLSREAHRKKQFKHNEGLGSNYPNKDYEEELASRRTIAEILRQDLLERDKKKIRQADIYSSSSIRPRDEVLPWRRRNNSPPRFSWGQAEFKREPKQLNINSIDQFPALK